MNAKEMSMEPIPTWYKEHRYPAKQQAKQAVFMDAAGWPFEIEPRDPESPDGDGPFQVGDNLKMQPDFLLHDTWCAPRDGGMFCLGDVFVEPKGKWFDRTVEQVKGLWLQRRKNVLMVDSILWLPFMSDHYDDSWGDDKPCHVTMYEGITDYVRSVKEDKAKRGFGKWNEYQFSLFVLPPCVMCNSICQNIECAPEGSSFIEPGCWSHRRMLSDMVLCVGHSGEPVIYQFSSLDDVPFPEIETGLFGNRCDAVKTRAAYKAAADADKNGLFTYDEDHPEYQARHSEMHRSPISVHQQYALDM